MSALDPANVDVLLLAAGYGKRLRPLTDKIPKPLVQVGGRPLIDWNLELIAKAGFTRVLINLFYLGNQIKAHVRSGRRYGLKVEYVPETTLLDTGGTIRNVQPLLRSPHLVSVNSDILIGRDFSFAELLQAHGSAGETSPLATLALRPDANAEQYGVVKCDHTGRVVAILDAALPETSYSPVPPVSSYMYMGIQILSSKAMETMPPQGTVFSLTRETFRTLIRNGEYLSSAIYHGYFSDIGTPERLEAASKDWS